LAHGHPTESKYHKGTNVTKSSYMPREDVKPPPTLEEQQEGARMWNSFITSQGRGDMVVPIPGNVSSNNNNIKMATDIKEGNATTESSTHPFKSVGKFTFVPHQRSNIQGFGSGELPLENELEKFASVNYIWSFGALSTNESNFPDRTYMKNGIKKNQLVIRSDGTSSARKRRTYAEQRYDIDTAYFIDDVNIQKIIAPNAKTRGSNAFGFSWKVHEPYSMGQFLQSMQLAAVQAQGPKANYLQVPWVLIMETIGELDNGKIARGPSRYFPLKIFKMDFNAGSSGSVYDVQANAWNDQALTDATQTIKADLTISGRDVEEMLQSGINSLTTGINTNLLNNRIKAARKDKGKWADTDEYIILFPKDEASSSFEHSVSKHDNTCMTGDIQYKSFDLDEAFKSGDTETLSGTGFNAEHPGESGSIEEQKRQFLLGRGGWSIKRSNLSEGIKAKYTGVQGEKNYIAWHKVTPPYAFSKGGMPFGISQFAYNGEVGILKRDSTVINKKERTVNFRAGTKISKIIEEVLLISSFGDKLANPDKYKDHLGMVNWFRIHTHVYTLDGVETEKAMGRKARIYVYRVLPYKVHIDKFNMPNAAPPGYDQLRTQAVKHYNYIYSGLNKDILDFNLEFNNAFYNSLAIDKQNQSESAKLSEKGSAQKEVTQDINPVEPTANQGQTAEFDKQNSGSQTAGATEETPERRIARSFNEAIMNSAVDLLTCDMTIMGDPYYMADSGVGNFNSEGSKYMNIKKNGAIDHESGEVDVIINFKTPIDLGVEGPKWDGAAIEVKDFSGLYKVWAVDSIFSGNEFRQELKMIRRRNQHTPHVSEHPIYADREKYDKAVAEAMENGDQYDIAFAKADLNADGKLSEHEVNLAGGDYADLNGREMKLAKMKAEGTADAARVESAERSAKIKDQKDAIAGRGKYKTYTGNVRVREATTQEKAEFGVDPYSPGLGPT